LEGEKKMEKRKLVLIGNGMAGVNCIEQLLKLDPDRYEITIVGSEPHPNYNRIQLSSVLAGDTEIGDIVLNDYAWYQANRITLHTGQTVTKINPKKKFIKTDQDLQIPYDDLILATGSLPFMLPLPGADKEGVIAFRNIKDCRTMMETAKKYKKAVVIGGGLLGLEAARGLIHLQMDVSVVHIFHSLMERQLDPAASVMLQKELEQQGMKFLLEKQTDSILGKKRVTGVRFKDGTEIETDLVVMAVGIRPNVSLARDCGIEVNRGIVVNDYLETNIKDIYAVGECAEHRGIAYGLVAPLFEQGYVLAKRLTEAETAGYQGSVVSTKLKVSGVNVFSAGKFMETPNTRTVRVQDDFQGIYKKVVIKDGKVIGSVLFGDTNDSSRIFALIRNGEDVTGKEHEILLGEGSCCKPQSDVDRVAVMASDEIVCGCNGVTKGAILEAITNKGLKSVDEIKACTKASASCGGCKPLVAALLAYSLGTDEVTEGKQGICSCTRLSRDEVVEAIRSMHLSTTKEVMNVLEWENVEGCSKCRPALNYYLGMIFPEDHRDERESRFVNERNHANIQHDGTYSVVPRIYGGVTSPQELRKIADVAEKYNVPMVKMTGGQRIDLLGIKKEDLPKIWEDLDMPSGYAYGKALRTVKTCVGAKFCRFGTHDSIELGITLEKKFERLDTPAKVKMAVSACPRNCAESGIKDVGIVAIEGGFELYVGGNGGIKARIGDMFVKVKTEAEVLEWTGAFLQYYRETAHYGERTSDWIERLGLSFIQKELESSETRRVLNERIEQTLNLKSDPWKEIIESKAVRKSFAKMPSAATVNS
jgi:nitrite reductase (NADH) large subunit